MGLQCSYGIGIDCDCPYKLSGGQCNCPVTKYWDGSICVARVGHNQPCNYDYQCTYGVGLICYEVSGAGTCQCLGFYNQ